MPRHAKHLTNLLLTLFRRNEDLIEVIHALEYAQELHLLNALVGTGESRVAFTLSAVGQIQAHGLDNAALFDELARRFPARANLVEAARHSYLDERPAEREIELVGLPYQPVAAGIVAHQEKIMGDRPNFLDVDYLAQGARIAKAVVKLRMRFATGWFNGTACLISPNRLLTAYHNIALPGGELTREVTAQFDYERVLGGPDREGMTLPCLVETIRGEAADDWAVIDLAAPQANRPVVPFSGTAACKDDRVAIIQHPAGQVKQVALHNNLVTYADATRLQYLTDTLPGSSGAPVFDSRWEMVGLHQIGGELPLPGTKQWVYRNQGTTIACIVDRITGMGLPLS